jgi:hypothetical protein
MASRRREDIKFLYDRDDGTLQVFAQQRYQDTVTGDWLTPLTPLFFARQVPSDSKVERPKEYKNRHVTAFVSNPSNVTGVSEMKTYIPYASGDLNHTAQLREILAFPRVICIDYLGETREKIS